jgi:hypothetical protein
MEEKAPSPGLEKEFIIFVVVALLIVLFPVIVMQFDAAAIPLLEYWPVLVKMAKAVIAFLIGLSIPVSVFLVIAIIYSVEQLKRVRKKEEEKYDLNIEPANIETGAASPDLALAKRWQSVMDHLNSPTPNDWRQAIIEADIILDELLTKMGYRGESVGEKLKRVSRGDFKTLDDAWEAHKVRNEIAHGGSAFSLNETEAKRVIGFYRNVFEEFFYL